MESKANCKRNPKAKPYIHTEFQPWMVDAFAKHIVDQSPNTFPRHYKIKVSSWERMKFTNESIKELIAIYNERWKAKSRWPG